jgi:hypothetical protein
MKINRLLLVGLILGGLAIYTACRKIDYSVEKEKKTIENRFYSAYPTSDKSVKAVHGYMKRVEEKYSFVDMMSE